jgi:NodT family efflux transporter outer membrane factor (OMF) lipoprotein
LLLSTPRAGTREFPAQGIQGPGLPVIAGLLMLLLTLSCAAPKPEVKPLTAVPVDFSKSGTDVLPEQWWLTFNDPVLTDLIQEALSGNFSLRSVWDRLTQAEAVANKAGAELWPSVTGRFDAARSRSEVDGRVPDEIVNGTDLSLGVVASYELDLWGRIRSTRDAAALDVLATHEQLQAAAITLSAQVAATWYALIEQRKQVEVLVNQTRVNGDVLEVITARWRSGQANAADVLRQRQLVESSRGELVLARATVTLLEHRLAILLGQTPKTPIAPAQATLPEPDPLPAAGLPSELIQNRPDIRQAYYAVRAADRRVAAAVADRYPRIGISASIDTSGDEWRDLFNNWMGTLAANAVAPLFDAGARRAEVDRTRAVVSESLNNYGQAVLDALGEVEDALEKERRQREYIVSVNKQLDLSQRTIARLKDSYLYGAVNYIDILEALISQQALERSQLQARRNLLEFRIDLCRALGSGWELPHPEPATLKKVELHEDDSHVR